MAEGWIVATALGPIELMLDAHGLVRRLAFTPKATTHEVGGLPEAAREIVEKLEAYVEGVTSTLDIPFVAAEGTEFERRVWAATSAIPRGQTRTYAQIAHASGNGRAVRAAGAALGRNPLLVLVPCHRVVGSDGSLTGYAGGLHIKQRLLEAEGCLLPHCT